jgi:hypothetical protein
MNYFKFINPSLFLAILLVFAQDTAAQSCNSLWREGQNIDEEINERNRIGNRNIEKFFRNFQAQVEGLMQYADQPDSNEGKGRARSVALTTIDHIDINIEFLEDTDDLIDEELDVISDLLDDCEDYYYSNERFFDRKEDTLYEMSDKNTDLQDKLLKLQERMVGYSREPHKFLMNLQFELR